MQVTFCGLPSMPVMVSLHGTAGSSASKSGQEENCPGTIESAYLTDSVASDEKLLETSRGLGTGGPAAESNFEKYRPVLAYLNIVFRNSIQNKVAGERVHFSKF